MLICPICPLTFLWLSVCVFSLALHSVAGRLLFPCPCAVPKLLTHWTVTVAIPESVFRLAGIPWKYRCPAGLEVSLYVVSAVQGWYCNTSRPMARTSSPWKRVLTPRLMQGTPCHPFPGRTHFTGISGWFRALSPPSSHPSLIRSQLGYHLFCFSQDSTSGYSPEPWTKKPIKKLSFE